MATGSAPNACAASCSAKLDLRASLHAAVATLPPRERFDGSA
jgi:hypothetical protein